MKVRTNHTHIARPPALFSVRPSLSLFFGSVYQVAISPSLLFIFSSYTTSASILIYFVSLQSLLVYCCFCLTLLAPLVHEFIIKTRNEQECRRDEKKGGTSIWDWDPLCFLLYYVIHIIAFLFYSCI